MSRPKYQKHIAGFYWNVNDHFSKRINTISRIDDGNLEKGKWSIIKGIIWLSIETQVGTIYHTWPPGEGIIFSWKPFRCWPNVSKE